MKTPIAVLSADWHLDSHAWADRPNLRGDSITAIYEITELAKKHKVPLIAAGDLLDKKRNTSGPVAAIQMCMDSMRTSKLPVYFVQGQHEMQSPPWLSGICPWCEQLQLDKAVDLSGFTLRGMDWAPKAMVSERLSELDADTDILVMHQVCEQLMGSIGSPELDCAQIPHAKVLVLGDYHIASATYQTRADGGQLLLVSPGSTHMRAINESPQHGVYLLFDDLSVEQQLLPSRIVITLPDLQREEEVDTNLVRLADALERTKQAAEDLPEHLAMPIVIAPYLRSLVGVGKRLTEAARGKAHLFLKPFAGDRVEAGKPVDVSEVELGSGDRTLLSCLPQVIDPVKDAAAFGLTQQLLTNESPAVILAKAREAAMEATVDDIEDERTKITCD